MRDAWEKERPPTISVTLNRRGIFILPSREGLLFAGMLVVMLVGAMNDNNNMVFLLAFLLLGFGLFSMLATYRNMAQLTLRVGSSAPVFAGDQARYTLLIDNTVGGPRFAVTLALDDSEPTRVDIPAQTVTPVVVTRHATRRGLMPMGRCTVSTHFPVGLFYAWAYLDLAMLCLVYPAPAQSHPLPPLEHSDHGRGEAHGQGAEDFVGLRQYISGDSPRHIAWKHAAHDGTLLTKQFAGEGDVHRWLTWDDVARGDVETRLSVLCRWVLSAQAAGVPYGLRLPGQESAPACTLAHRDACLKALALYGAA